MATATDVSELLTTHPRPSEVDREALAHYSELYQKYGEYEGYSPGFDPSIVPEHERRPGRRIFK